MYTAPWTQNATITALMCIFVHVLECHMRFFCTFLFNVTRVFLQLKGNILWGNEAFVWHWLRASACSRSSKKICGRAYVRWVGESRIMVPLNIYHLISQTILSEPLSSNQIYVKEKSCLELLSLKSFSKILGLQEPRLVQLLMARIHVHCTRGARWKNLVSKSEEWSEGMWRKNNFRERLCKIYFLT